jgi:integrase
VLVTDYAATWIDERPGLRPKSVKNYSGLLRCQVAPYLATVTVGELTLPRVRRWRMKLLDAGTSPITTAKAYRFLRAVMATAVDDGLIKRNPCRIKGAGTENSPERPVLTVTQVYALADAVGLRYRALILLATFTSLRWAELAALRPEDIDLDARTVRVTRQLYYHDAGHSFGPPKSRAGVRDVDFPELIVPDLREHLVWVPSSALVFASSTGAPLAHSNFRQRIWLPALAAVGLEGVHLHDLRHTGNQLTANAGANLRELMARMGHDSERAALIYLHSSRERQRALTDAVGEAARAELVRSRPHEAAELEGTRRARARNSQAAAVDRQGSRPAQDVRPDRDSNAGPTA